MAIKLSRVGLPLLFLFASGCAPTYDPAFPRPIPTLTAAPSASPVLTGVTLPPPETNSTLVPTHSPQPPEPVGITLGNSVEGRPITAWQAGDGATTIMLIGGMHGGYEGNTVTLANLLIEHFRKHPYDVLPGIHLVIIPLANPDGLARGAGLAGRLNAHGVDLNRNWACGWSDTAYLQDVRVDPGPYAFSEPETVALRDFFRAARPDAVIFYHSAAGGVFMGACNGSSPGSDWMPGVLSAATGYPAQTFTHYDVTGDATNWLAGMDVPSAVIELSSADRPEFISNLAGAIALQCHFALERIPDAAHLPVIQRLCL